MNPAAPVTRIFMRLPQASQAPVAHLQVAQFPMWDRKHRSIVVFRFEGLEELESVLVPALTRIRPGIVDVDARPLTLELAYHVDNLGVAHVRAVLLECDPENEHPGTLYVDALRGHVLEDLGSHVERHVVIQPPPR